MLISDDICRNSDTELVERSLDVDKVPECGAVPRQTVVGQDH